METRNLMTAAGTTVLVLATGFPANAHAQQSVIEEIIVTARKREETLRDVPFAVSAQTEQTLRNSGATDLESLSGNVPAFTVQNLGPGQSQVAMRGISAGQIVRDQPGVKEQVGVYVDESVISLSLFTPDLEPFDLNRVEVLRGPQGTLFGSGSLSGTVRYITNQPNLSEREGALEATGVSIEEGDNGGDVKGMINLPLIEDSVAVRAVAFHRSYGGFIDAVQPDGVDKNVNDGTRTGFRAALTFQNENLTVTPRVIYQDIDIDGYNRIDAYNILANPFTTTRPPVTLGKREQFTQFKEKFEDEFWLGDVTIEYDFGPIVFTSVSSYSERDVLVKRDATQLTGSVTGQPGVFTATGLPESVFTLDAPLFDATDFESFTQEIRLASNYEGQVEWVAGVFYSDIEKRYGQDLPVTGFEALANPILGTPAGWTAGPLAPVDTLFFSDIPYDFKQIAVFGEATYAISEQLRMTFGLRWFDFEEKRILNFDGLFADRTIGQPGKTTSVGASPRMMLSYDATDNLQINGQISKGFRLGGINDPLNIPLCTPQDLVTFGDRPDFEDETLINYELGTRAILWNGRATLNVAVFLSEIENLQATVEAGTCSSRIVFNVPEARALGVEAELFMRPTDNFDFTVAASFIDSELKSTVTSTDALGNTTVVGGIEKGNPLPTVPEFQASASAAYNWPVFADWEGFLIGVVQHVGSRWTQLGDQAPGFDTVDLTSIPIGNPTATTFSFDPKMPSYETGNIRLGMHNDRWELAFFVNNVWDERAFLALDRERGRRARVGFLTNQPRTFGLTARVNF